MTKKTLFLEQNWKQILAYPPGLRDYVSGGIWLGEFREILSHQGAIFFWKLMTELYKALGAAHVMSSSLPPTE